MEGLRKPFLLPFRMLRKNSRIKGMEVILLPPSPEAENQDSVINPELSVFLPKIKIAAIILTVMLFDKRSEISVCIHQIQL